MKILDGKELAGFIKERQATEVRSFSQKPKLLIIRDNENPVIKKYVNLKIRYGDDIGAIVEDFYTENPDEIAEKIATANHDQNIHGIIIQLPLTNKENTDSLVNLINPEKDVDGLGENSNYDSATATAILWLLTGYDVKLENQKIALVGRGKLVGMPLFKMFKVSNYDVEIFHRGSDLTKLKNFDIIISATGVPGLISDNFVKPGAILVDAGTASEKGVIKGDLDEKIRERKDLSAITPKLGGVGPLTVTCLFEHLLQAFKEQSK